MNCLVAVKLRLPTTTAWGLLRDYVEFGKGKAANCWSYDTAWDTSAGAVEGGGRFENAVADGRTNAIGDKNEDGQRRNFCSGERQERLLGARWTSSFKLGHIMENTERIPKSAFAGRRNKDSGPTRGYQCYLVT